MSQDTEEWTDPETAGPELMRLVADYADRKMTTREFTDAALAAYARQKQRSRQD